MPSDKNRELRRLAKIRRYRKRKAADKEQLGKRVGRVLDVHLKKRKAAQIRARNAWKKRRK